MEPPLLVSIRDAAARLSCSEADVWEWLSEGQLQGVKVGRLTRIQREDIEAIVRLGCMQQGRRDKDEALASDETSGSDEASALVNEYELDMPLVSW